MCQGMVSVQMNSTVLVIVSMIGVSRQGPGGTLKSGYVPRHGVCANEQYSTCYCVYDRSL